MTTVTNFYHRLMPGRKPKVLRIDVDVNAYNADTHNGQLEFWVPELKRYVAWRQLTQTDSGCYLVVNATEVQG